MVGCFTSQLHVYPMRTSPTLSSSLTFLNKWIFPALFLPGWPLWILSALRGPWDAWIFAILWSIACVALLLLSWQIKLVAIEGDYFVISNYFAKRRVPIAHLVSITENSYFRAPAITLHFEPPTPFGSRVLIIPPVGFFNNEGFDEAVTFLRDLLNDQERYGAGMRAG